MNLLKFYQNKRVFITGHTGFKGSWLCRVLARAGADVYGFALPTPEEPSLFSLCGESAEIKSTLGDIRDRLALQEAYRQANPEVVFHLAAQPLVRESYKNPAYTYETNVMGTVNLLECVRSAASPPLSVLNVTTDKVYENKEWEWGYRENEPLDGYDPYSNSKSCSELVTHSYKRCYFDAAGVAVSTARAGNVIGGGDFAKDRILPDCVRAAREQKPIIVRNPRSVRPYQHVLDPLLAYLAIAKGQSENPALAGAYNVGPENSDCVNTGTLATLFCQHWPGATWKDMSEPDAPHEAGFLKLDSSKIKNCFSWKPVWNVEKAVKKTVEWNIAFCQGKAMQTITEQQIREFLEDSE